MAKTTITAHERLMLIGLLTLAKSHNAALRSIESAAYEITQECDSEGVRMKAFDGGHTSDACYSDYDVDELLSKLGLSVEEPPAADAVDPHAGSTGTPSTRDTV